MASVKLAPGGSVHVESALSVGVALLGMLADARFTWRKVATLAEELGQSVSNVRSILRDTTGVIASETGYSFRLENAEEKTLRKMLSDSEYCWRKVETLARGIGKSASDTRTILGKMVGVESSDTGRMYTLYGDC